MTLRLVLASAAASILTLTAGTATAETGGFTFGGVDVSEGGAFVYGGAGFRPQADIDSDGLLLRVAGSYGTYTYDRGAAIPEGEGRAASLDLMVGAQNVGDNLRVSGYVGANYQDHDIDNDPTNPVQGGEWGIKGQVEVYAEPTPNTMLLAIASYSSANSSYFGLGKVGWKVNRSVYVGPEIAVSGNERYDQVRGGLHATGFKVGPVGFGVSVGYVSNSPGNGGVYGGAGFTFRY